MKLLIIHPGASWATADLYAGLTPAFERAGHEVIHYALDGRLWYSGRWLHSIYRWNKKETPKPNQADIMYHASVGAIERALRHDVDWVLCITGQYMHPDVLTMLHRAGRKVAILFTESPYADHWQMAYAKNCDLCWVNERTSAEKFRATGANCHYYQHAIDPEKHHAGGDDDEDVPAHDVVFVGTGWIERIKLLEAVNWDGIDLGLYGSYSLLGSRHRLRKYIKGGIIDNRLTAALYRRAKIGINIHRTSIDFGREVAHIEGAESMNPRCYELAACGAFFVSDYRAELEETFGALVPTFETPEQLQSIINGELNFKAHWRYVSEILPDMVKHHTFDVRVKQMAQVMMES